MRRKTVQELVKEIVGEDPCILIDDSEESRKALEIVKDFERKYGLEGYIRVFRWTRREPSDYLPALFVDGPFIPCEGVERIKWYFNVYVPHEIEERLKK